MYITTLTDCRIGANLSYDEAKKHADIIKPLLDNGQSPYAILTNHPELKMCEKTLYNRVQNNIYKDFGIDVFSHRRKLSMKPRKATILKLRKSRKHLINRTYNDFNKCISMNPHLSVVEMDTVYNDISNGPFMQTFYIRKLRIIVSILHDEKTSKTMLEGIILLKKLLKPYLFNKYFNILITDRGNEFYAAEEIENIGVLIFYCDPMASYQKACLENIHGPLRFIVSKAEKVENLRKLGLETQADLNAVISHVNSYTLEELGGKSRFDYLKFIAPKDYKKILERLGLTYIKKDDVIMSPKLFEK